MLLIFMLGFVLDLNVLGKVIGVVSYIMFYNCLDFFVGVVFVIIVIVEDEV